MSSIVKLITVIPRDVAINFIETKQIENLDTMPRINTIIKKEIREFIRDNVGYDNEPIAGLSRFNGNISELKTVGTAVAEYIPTKAGSTLWQLHMPSDMVVSINFMDLLNYSEILSGVSDPFELEMYLEEFRSKITLGYLEDDDVISFIPFIDLNKCKFFAMLDKSWSIGELSVPGVEQVKLVNLDVF